MKLFDPDDPDQGDDFDAATVQGSDEPDPKAKRGGHLKAGSPIGPKPGDAPDWRPIFLHYLRNFAGIELAAVKAGVNPRTVQRARKRDRKFDERVERTLKLRAQALERVALKRALAGDSRILLAMLRANIPEKYGKNPRPQTTVQPITIIEIVPAEPRKPPVIGSEAIKELPGQDVPGIEIVPPEGQK